MNFNNIYLKLAVIGISLVPVSSIAQTVNLDNLMVSTTGSNTVVNINGAAINVNGGNTAIAIGQNKSVRNESAVIHKGTSNKVSVSTKNASVTINPADIPDPACNPKNKHKKVTNQDDDDMDLCD